jgi:plasmid maintenance system killer protein
MNAVSGNLAANGAGTALPALGAESIQMNTAQIAHEVDGVLASISFPNKLSQLIAEYANNIQADFVSSLSDLIGLINTSPKEQQLSDNLIIKKKVSDIVTAYFLLNEEANPQAVSDENRELITRISRHVLALTNGHSLESISELFVLEVKTAQLFFDMHKKLQMIRVSERSQDFSLVPLLLPFQSMTLDN